MVIGAFPQQPKREEIFYIKNRQLPLSDGQYFKISENQFCHSSLFGNRNNTQKENILNTRNKEALESDNMNQENLYESFLV